MSFQDQTVYITRQDFQNALAQQFSIQPFENSDDRNFGDIHISAAKTEWKMMVNRMGQTLGAPVTRLFNSSAPLHEDSFAPAPDKGC